MTSLFHALIFFYQRWALSHNMINFKWVNYNEEIVFYFSPPDCLCGQETLIQSDFIQSENPYLVIILYLETKPKCLAYEDLK